MSRETMIKRSEFERRCSSTRTRGPARENSTGSAGKWLRLSINSTAVKKLIVDLLAKLAESTDNDVDDTAVNALRIALKV